MPVDADREDLNTILFFFGQKALQLAELLRAVGSPLASIKHQDDVLLTIDFRKSNSPSVHVFQGEVRCDIPTLTLSRSVGCRFAPSLGPNCAWDAETVSHDKPNTTRLRAIFESWILSGDTGKTDGIITFVIVVRRRCRCVHYLPAP